MAALPAGVAEASRNSLGLFLQDIWSRSARVTVTGNLRLDWLSDVGARLSPRAAVVVSLPRDLTLKLLYGQSFRAPTFAELYFKLPGYQGNADLKPVTSQTLEANLGLRRTNLRLSAGAYLNRVRGAILAERPDSALESLRLTNAADIDVVGLEAEGRASLGLNALFGSLTLQSPRFTDGGGRVPDLPAALVTLGATVAAGRHETATVTWLIRSVRPRARDDARRRLAGYGVMNVNLLRERALRGLDVSLAIDNALNLKYHDPAPALTLPGDYERPGRSVRLSVRYRL
jgi:outer membrane receptor protein involved in Fe transport